MSADDPNDFSSPVPPPESPPEGLRGLDPGELLARGLQTAKLSGGRNAWEPPTPEELNRLLPQYNIESLIGRGGMGAVYKGTQVILDRPVAIKLLPAEIAADEQFVIRFHREARTLARLQHSRIITIHDFGQTAEGHLYFVMEYIDGTNLREILRGPGLNPEQALLVTAQICDALQTAHAQGVIHRDIKPENILVTQDGYVKLADFGLSRPMQQEDVSALTGTNIVMGTADYMAPEQREGQADQRADIFALGVMLYEMLTGKPPRGAFEPASRKVQLDVRIDQVVLKALQAEPSRRYQQISDMKTDVDCIRNTPLPSPVADAAPQPQAQAPKRSKAEPSPRKSQPPRPLSSPAPPSRPRSMNPLVVGLAVSILGFAAFWHFGGSGRPIGASRPKGPLPGRPWTNSLGMKFVPVPEIDALFCVWETRVHDYAWYAKSHSDTTDNAWSAQTVDGQPVSRAPNEPVVGVSWFDANAFCKWLTEYEITEGKLPKGAVYRLPTDAEWSAAAGLGKEEGATPNERSFHNKGLFPWGSKFPPVEKVGNFADETLKAAFPSKTNILKGYTDGFATTAPVASFPPNQFGIYDLSGNAWEWCEDRFDFNSDDRVLRGGSYFDSGPDALYSTKRIRWGPGARNNSGGFRCVLSFSGSRSNAASVTAPPVTPLPSLPPMAYGEERSIFNGKDLTGWQGYSEFWSVQDGVLTGKFVAGLSKPSSTLLWQGGLLSNFEISCKFRLTTIGSNRNAAAGVGFRAQIINDGPFIRGYYGDLRSNHDVTGSLWDGIRWTPIARQGQKVAIRDGSDPRHPEFDVLGSLGEPQQLQSFMKKNEWNDYKISAIGNHIQIFVNGRQTVDVLDKGEWAPKSGVLGLGVAGDSLVQFKDIKLRSLQSVEECERRAAAVRQGGVSPVISASERAALENSMVASKWSWKYRSFPSDNPMDLVFGRDGIASSPQFRCSWKITGPHTVIIAPFNMPISLQFDQSLTRFDGSLLGGDFYYAGQRIPPPNQQPAPVRTPTPQPVAQNEALTKALLSHAWSWNAMAPASFPWKEIVFWSDGTVSTSTTVTGRWTIAGWRSVAIQFIGGSGRILLNLNSSMDYFTGSSDDGKLVASGRLMSLAETASAKTVNAAPPAAAQVSPFPATDAGFTRGPEVGLFNGRDLAGWEGRQGYWSVENGAITGKITAANLSSGNTFLVWRGGEPADFELRCRYRLVPNNPEGFANSGIQFRARYSNRERFELKGYQGEMDPGTNHPGDWPAMPNMNGCLTDDGPGILLAPTGQKVIIHPGEVARRLGRFDMISSLGTSQSSSDSFRKYDWNDYRIVAFRNHIQIFVNGLQTVDAIDEGNRFTSGLIGFQLHGLNRAKILQFKDIYLRELHGTLAVSRAGMGRPPTTVNSPAAPASPAAKQTFGSYQEEAVLGHNWSWDTVAGNGSHQVVQFLQDGRLSTGWHWQWLPKPNGELVVDCFSGEDQHLFLKFDKQFSEFEGYGQQGGCQVRGKRLVPIDGGGESR